MVKPKFLRKVLKNGITVLLEQRKGTGVISIGFGIRAGGINETSAEKGISHFIEHMLYKGTTKRSSKQISEEIEKNGGILNGFTDEEATAYWCKIPSKHLNIALDVLSDMIKNSKFDETELNKERKVILEEIKMRKDTPQIYVYDKIPSLMLKGDAGLNLIGDEKTLMAIDRAKMVSKFKEMYSSNNIFLCAAGDCDFKKLCNFCEKNFDKSSSEINEPKLEEYNRQVSESRTGIDQASLILAYHIPLQGGKLNYAAQVLNCIMAGGMSSRLFQEIREKRNLAYTIRGSVHSGKRFGYTSIYAGTSPENIERVRSLILEEFVKFVKEGNEKELNQAKEQMLGNNKISKEDSQGQMFELIYHEAWNRAKEIYTYEKNIKKVKLSEVKLLAKQLISKKNYSFVSLIPK